MNIEITTRSQDIPQALRHYSEERLAGVERLGEEFDHAEIVFSSESDETVCEVILHRHRGDPLIATGRSRESRAAVDAATSRLERQFVRFKEKHNHKGKRQRAS